MPFIAYNFDILSWFFVTGASTPCMLSAKGKLIYSAHMRRYILY